MTNCKIYYSVEKLNVLNNENLSFNKNNFK